MDGGCQADVPSRPPRTGLRGVADFTYCTTLQPSSIYLDIVLDVPPLGVGPSRPPRASWTVETTKAAQGTIIPTPLKLRTQAIDFPIDYCRENRYNGLWAQKISAVWGWFLTGTPYIGPGGLPPPRPALCFCYLVAHYSLCWKINQGFLARFALVSRDFFVAKPTTGAGVAGW